MKRLLVFILLGPVLFVLCVWVLFLPLASLAEGGAVRFNLEVDSFLAVLLSVMFGGFALALVDWVADMLVMSHRPHRVGFWRPGHRSLVRPVPAGLVVVHRQRPSGEHPGPGLLLAGQKIAKSGGIVAASPLQSPPPKRTMECPTRRRQSAALSLRLPSLQPHEPPPRHQHGPGAARVVRDHDLHSRLGLLVAAQARCAAASPAGEGRRSAARAGASTRAARSPAKDGGVAPLAFRSVPAERA